MIRTSVAYRIDMHSLSSVSSLPVSFGQKLATSSAFDQLFRDGMALVETTAGYLDGDGREQSRHLGRVAALAYASESMRLTTRLMQIASWLLLQRAVNEGEISAAEAAADKGRTRSAWQSVPDATEESLHVPPQLSLLMTACGDLQDRIQRLDRVISEPGTPDARPNPLDGHMLRLRQAFEA